MVFDETMVPTFPRPGRRDKKVEASGEERKSTHDCKRCDHGSNVGVNVVHTEEGSFRIALPIQHHNIAAREHPKRISTRWPQESWTQQSEYATRNLLALVLLVYGGNFLGRVHAQQVGVANLPSMKDLAEKFAGVIRSAACDTLRTGGVGCSQPGLQDALQSIHTQHQAYRPIKMRLDKKLEEDMLPQINEVFANASRMIITLRDSMESLIITGHRIESIKGRRNSELPKWDAKNPRWKNATDYILNGKLFDKPVLKESSLKYPPFVHPGERKVMIAANSSDGLDEFFANNLIDPDNRNLRWQRFVSNTGMTRQFPGTFDDGEYDNRFSEWYRMATQAPKRIIFLLDLSENMSFENKIDIAKITILTLLDTLIHDDYVNVVLIDNMATTPECFSKMLVPASQNNINELKRFVKAATVGASDELYGAFNKAETMLEETDRRLKMAEKLRSPNYLSKDEKNGLNDKQKEAMKVGCLNFRCTEMHEYLMLVSDGTFKLEKEILDRFEEMSVTRPLLHGMAIAIGDTIQEHNMKTISCRMKGLYFHIEPIKNNPLYSTETRVAQESDVLNKMNEYFQMVASPLARNHSLLNGIDYSPMEKLSPNSLDATWTLPGIDSKNEAVIITIALPCFGDTDKPTPRLIGAVAIDLIFLLSGELFGQSMISYFFDVEKNEPSNGMFDMGIVFKSGYAGYSLFDNNLLYYYELGIDSMESFSVPQSYPYLDYLGEGFQGDQGKDLLSRILSETSGVTSLSFNKSLPLNAEQWMNEPLAVDFLEMSVAWLHVPGHPFVLVLSARGKPDSEGMNTFMEFSPFTPESTTSLRPQSPIALCSNSSQPDEVCWSLQSGRHLMAFDPMQEWGPWWYNAKNTFGSTVSFIQQDAWVLPPKCKKPALQCEGQKRLKNLMDSTANFENGAARILGISMTGTGLTTNAFKDLLLTSLVEPMWKKSFKDDNKVARRLFITSPRGVMRTIARPPSCATSNFSNASRQCALPTQPFSPPFLYSPQSESWYNRPHYDRQGRIALSPSGGADVFLISKVVRHGFIQNSDPDFGISTTAAVLGAELDYDYMHGVLFGENKLKGYDPDPTNTASCICGSGDKSNSSLCIIVDLSATVLWYPDKQAISGKRATFLGELEPALMDWLVFNGVFIKTVRSSVEVSSKTASASVMTYSVDEKKLPLERQLNGNLRGLFMMDSIPDTNSFFLFIEHYSAPNPIQGCGVLSSQCPHYNLPSILDIYETMCAFRLEDVLFVVAGDQRMLPGFDMNNIVDQIGKTMSCEKVFPSWIQWALLAGFVIVSTTLCFFTIDYVMYLHRRNLYIHQENDPNTPVYTDMPKIRDQHHVGEENLAKLSKKVSKLFMIVQDLDAKACSVDDFRVIMQIQTNLIENETQRKQLVEDLDNAKLQGLGKDICLLRLVTYNLKQRIQQIESSASASDMASLRQELVVLDSNCMVLLRKLESKMLPTIHVDTAVDTGNGNSSSEEIDSDEDAKQKAVNAQEIKKEEDFYKQFYPHLIQYSSGQEEIEPEDMSLADATHISEMTQRSINEKGVKEAREQLRVSLQGTALLAQQAKIGADTLARKDYMNTGADLSLAIDMKRK